MKLILRRAIAAIEMLGGAAGALLFLRHALRVMHAQPDVWLAVPLPVAAFGLCVLAGALLWLPTPSGYLLTLVALALQVPSVRTARLGYSFEVGVGARVLVGSHRVSWFAFVGSEWHVTLREAAVRPVLGINLVALAFCALVWTMRPVSRSVHEEAYGA